MEMPLHFPYDGSRKLKNGFFRGKDRGCRQLDGKRRTDWRHVEYTDETVLRRIFLVVQMPLPPVCIVAMQGRIVIVDQQGMQNLQQGCLKEQDGQYPSRGTVI
ncbi:MAG: hypothetical protein RLY31_944 [Bacteroidota bacterium]|jgi:hypothetical protein